MVCLHGVNSSRIRIQYTQYEEAVVIVALLVCLVYVWPKFYLLSFGLTREVMF